MKIVKLLGALIGVAVLALAGFLAFVSVRGIPHYEPQKVDLKVEVTPERVARGKRWASMLCAECHGNPRTGQLTGADMRIDDEFGKIFSLNITQHPVKGIGQWTDGEIAYLIRTGVARDGRYTPPWMAKLPHMSDEDLHSIIAFLRSDDPMVKAADVDDYPSQPNLISKVLATLVFKPYPYPTKPITAPPLSDKVAYGQYLVYNLDCYTCHSADFKKINPLDPPASAGFLAGGNPINDYDNRLVYSSNLTMDEETGLGKWTEDEFVRALRYGVRPDNTAIRYPMSAYPALSDEEARAIWAYLQTVPKIRNPRTVSEVAAPATADDGMKLYYRYGCNSCHSENGVGVCDLTQNKSQYPTDEELAAFIREPAKKFPETRMPTWAEVIPDAELQVLMKHVRRLSALPAGASPTQGGQR